MTVTVYSKPACPACAATYRNLNKNSVEYATVDFTQDAEAFTYIKDELGHAEAPVVVVRDADGAVVNHWSGFNDDELKALAR